MICKHCREGARLALPEVLPLHEPFTEVTVTYPYSARQSHERCRGGTWCDCQHVLPVPGQRSHPTLD